jgi:hypothetical protein
MSIHHIDTGFTGSVSSFVAPDVVRLLMPFRISVQVVENVTNGKVTDTHYDWRVEMCHSEIARRNVYLKPPKTREAAVRQARKAIRQYCEFQLSNIHKR